MSFIYTFECKHYIKIFRRQWKAVSVILQENTLKLKLDPQEKIQCKHKNLKVFNMGGDIKLAIGNFS